MLGYVCKRYFIFYYIQCIVIYTYLCDKSRLLVMNWSVNLTKPLLTKTLNLNIVFDDEWVWLNLF